MEIMGNNNACKCVNGKYWEIMGNTDGKYWEILGNTGKYWEILGNTGNHQIYIFITSKSKHLPDLCRPCRTGLDHDFLLIQLEGNIHAYLRSCFLLPQLS